MRFEPDGRFAWGLTGPQRDMRGRYTQDAGTVTVTLDRWSLCRAGDTYTWRATLGGEDRLHLVNVSGTERRCLTATTGVWSARRLQVGHRPWPAHPRTAPNARSRPYDVAGAWGTGAPGA